MPSNRMQPPLVIEPLYRQIQRIKDEAEKSNAKSKALYGASLTYSLEEKLLLWIQSLTPEQLKRPYTTTEIIKLASLTGKCRARPALQQVAQILRKYGFKHKRSWKNNSRNQRYWLNMEVSDHA